MRAGTAAAPVAVTVDAPEGVDVEALERTSPRLGVVGAPIDRTGVVAWNAFDASTALTLRAGARPERAVRVDVVGRDAPGADGFAAPAAGHLLVVAEPGSAGTVIVDP